MPDWAPKFAEFRAIWPGLLTWLMVEPPAGVFWPR